MAYNSNNNSNSNNNIFSTPTNYNFNSSNNNNNNNTNDGNMREWKLGDVPISVRSSVVSCISQLALQNKLDEERLIKINGFASLLENQLYNDASSYEEYINPYTIVNRIQKILTANMNHQQTANNSSVKLTNYDNFFADFVSIGLSPTFMTPMTPKNSDNIEKEKKDENNTKVISKTETSNNVSSAGCSREFIVKVLEKILEYGHSDGFRYITDIDEKTINKIFSHAKEECSFDEGCFYGGTDIKNDKKSYWTETRHFFTWWKNNLTRKNKIETLKKGAAYTGSDISKLATANYSSKILQLHEEITQCVNEFKDRSKKGLVKPKIKPDIETIVDNDSKKNLKKNNNNDDNDNDNDINININSNSYQTPISKTEPLIQKSELFTNLLNAALLYKDTKSSSSDNDDDNDNDYKKRKATDNDNSKSKRSTPMTEEQEDFIASLSSLSSSSPPLLLTPSSILKIEW